MTIVMIDALTSSDMYDKDENDEYDDDDDHIHE